MGMLKRMIDTESANDSSSSPNTDNSNRAPKGIPLETILELRDKKLTLEQIGKIVGCTKQTVSQRLREYQPVFDRIERFKKHRGDLLTWKQAEILNSLTERDLNNASLLQRTTAFGILYDKERLERGQSTENLSIKSITQSLGKEVEEISRKRVELMKMMDEG